jgi:hypothetical protein
MKRDDSYPVQLRYSKYAYLPLFAARSFAGMQLNSAMLFSPFHRKFSDWFDCLLPKLLLVYQSEQFTCNCGFLFKETS